MNKILVLTSFSLSFILMMSLVSITSKQMALAVDLSSIKQKATNLLTGNSNSTISKNNSISGLAGNSTSSLSNLKQKATNTIGNLLR